MVAAHVGWRIGGWLAPSEPTAAPFQRAMSEANEEHVATRPEDVAMAAYAGGDDRALGIVYDALGGRLFAFLTRRARDRELAEDLLQQTFLQIHRNRSSFSAGAAVAPWAFAIARRLLIDAMRAKTRLRKNFGDRDEDAMDRLAGASNPELAAGARQETAQLFAKLEALPEAQRVAFELIRIDGLSMAEAAEMLGTTVTAMKLRAHRAYKALGLAGESGVDR